MAQIYLVYSVNPVLNKFVIRTPVAGGGVCVGPQYGLPKRKKKKEFVDFWLKGLTPSYIFYVLNQEIEKSCIID